MLLVGSHAAAIHKINRRMPKDVDLWVCDESLLRSASSLDVSHIPEKIMRSIPTTEEGIPTADALLTIKLSHFQWDIHWEKTKLDILHMKDLGCTNIPILYNKLVAHWKGIHGNKEFLSLDKSKKDFFNDFVSYKYDHDYLHEVVAYPNNPVYTKCLKDGADVLIDKKKFDRLPFELKVKMFREEITVIAYERYLLNKRFTGGVLKAYQMALKKTITNLTKEWASDFLVLNIEEFIKPDYDMFNKLQTKIERVNTMTNNIKEIIKKLAESVGESEEYVLYAMAEGDAYGDLERELDKIGYKHLEQEGGGEGGTEYCFGVFELEGLIFKAEYSYYSYNGCDYDGILETLKQVKPVEKVVTVYE